MPRKTDTRELTHSAVQKAVARHLKKPFSTIVVDELCNGTFGYTKRLDVVAYTPNAQLIRVVECKASRADFIRGLAALPGYMALCHQFYVAAPKDLIKLSELPDGAGLMEVTSDGRVRQKRYAPKRDMEPKTYSFVLSRFLQKLIVQQSRMAEEELQKFYHERNKFTFWLRDLEREARSLL